MNLHMKITLHKVPKPCVFFFSILPQNRFAKQSCQIYYPLTIILTFLEFNAQISVTITEKFTAIKPESQEMSRTIMAVINEAGRGGGGADGVNAVVIVIHFIPCSLTIPLIHRSTYDHFVKG